MQEIVMIDGLYKLPELILNSPNEKRFDYIYNSGAWAKSTNGESVSGSGSTIAYTELYRDQLKQFFGMQSDTLTFFDAPCGDLNWIKELFDKVNYIGGDISGDLINHLKIRHPDVSLNKFDIIKDDFPDADVWHCRHCLFHMSLSDIALAFENFCRSNIQYALITNHFLPDRVTFDIPTGSFRFLDLTNYPFYLPAPQVYLLDSDLMSGKTSMASGLWNKSDLNHGLENYLKFVKQ